MLRGGGDVGRSDEWMLMGGVDVDGWSGCWVEWMLGGVDVGWRGCWAEWMLGGAMSGCCWVEWMLGGVDVDGPGW